MAESDVRPWGSYEVLVDDPEYKVKRITVSPGERLSYQRHALRAEHWFVVLGQGLLVLADEEREVGPGDAIDIGVAEAHRIGCTGDVPLVFIEVQHGTSFAEDDIERLQDDYAR